MKEKASKIETVIDELKPMGFKYVGKTPAGKFKLKGQLTTTNGAHPCELELDANFMDLPIIKLTTIPPSLHSITPHLGGDGGLCYIAKNTVVLDIFDPAGQTIACIRRAEEVLGQTLNGEMVNDLEEEFYAYWGGGHICLVDMQEHQLGKQLTLVVQPGEDPMPIVTDDRDRTIRKLEALKYEVTDKTIITYRVQTNAKPRPDNRQWPPKTVQDLLDWQGLLDLKCRKKIDKRIEDAVAANLNAILILIESPLLTYGFTVFINSKNANKSKSKASRNYRYSLPIFPLWVVRIDDRYLAERNNPGKQTLAGKNITVIGCGTIGGYLTEMLVKSGAGTSGGLLTIVDFEILLPQNIGRHRLGFPHLFMNKAAGLVDEMKRLAPGANIRALATNVLQVELGSIDLLIDATGEESLGHWLCNNYKNTPMLTVWIEGPGVAVRGFLHSDSNMACFRCLHEANKANRLMATQELIPKLLAGQGCEGLYVPFPASVSVQAASLGANIVIDWANGISSPALRTHILDDNFHSTAHDVDPPRETTCPVCHS